MVDIATVMRNFMQNLKSIANCTNPRNWARKQFDISVLVGGKFSNLCHYLMNEFRICGSRHMKIEQLHSQKQNNSLLSLMKTLLILWQ